MNVNKIASKITIRPTNKKMKQAKQFIENSGLPKEMPLKKRFTTGQRQIASIK